MSIESDLYTALSGHAGLAALVGARIYPDGAPQDAAYPLIVVTLIASTPTVSLAGDSGQDASRWQVSAWGETFDQVVAVIDAVRAAMAAATAFRSVPLAMYAGPVEPDLRLYHRIAEFSTWQ